MHQRKLGSSLQQRTTQLLQRKMKGGAELRLKVAFLLALTLLAFGTPTLVSLNVTTPVLHRVPHYTTMDVDLCAAMWRSSPWATGHTSLAAKKVLVFDNFHIRRQRRSESVALDEKTN